MVFALRIPGLETFSWHQIGREYVAMVPMDSDIRFTMTLEEGRHSSDDVFSIHFTHCSYVKKKAKN